MGLFQQRPEEQENEWALPSEPLERGEAELLDAAPAIDPMSLGLGSTPDISVVVFPVAPIPPAAVSTEAREPD